MLMALIAVLFLGGGVQDAVLDHIGETRGSVKEVINERDRRSDINATLDQMKKRSKQRGRSGRQALKTLQAAMSDHEVNQAEIDRLFDDYLQSLKDYNEDMIDLRFQLRDQLNREEWEALFGD